ncbi:MAG: sodium:calcium antiporter [Clostridia bacterium]|nr:sodium:calcium antiporter [Clostridia bacterium]
MWGNIAALLAGLAVILLSCELFTNGIEWLGKKLKVGDGVVGSIFSAVGTCLPETMIPIIAILFSDHSKDAMDVGIGAIIGAPFMLSTLAFFITGLGVLLFWKKRKTGLKMQVDNTILSRDIGFFIVVYSLGIAASFVNDGLVRYSISVFLVIAYLYYVLLTVRNDSMSHNELEKLYTAELLGVKPNVFFILVQIAVALIGIVLGAHLFVQNLEVLAHVMNISTLVLSLIIAPIATELPEKFNSVIWISKNKDTLALGNITGAMVFQSCIPVAIGIYATRWNLELTAVVSAVLSILSAVLTYGWIKLKGKVSPFPLIMGGLFYAVYIYFLYVRGFK